MTPDESLALPLQLFHEGRLDEAEGAVRQVLAQHPRHVGAMNLLAAIVGQGGRVEEAVGILREALKVAPDVPALLSNLANYLVDVRQYEEAAECAARAVALDPQFVAAYTNLGRARFEQGRYPEATAAFERVVALHPQDAVGRARLGMSLQCGRRYEAAIAAYRQALALQPGWVDVMHNLGAAYQFNRQFDEAMATFHEVLRIAPRMAQTHEAMGNALRDMGLHREALAAYRRAIEIDPASPAQHSMLLLFNYMPEVSQAEILAELQRWRQARVATLESTAAPHANDRNPGRRLRIGYVSPDFVSHSLNYFFLPVLREHDRDVFEIHCYASVTAPDAVTGMLRAAAPHWHDVLGASNEALAARIRADGIDILVDLSMHMPENRLEMFARKPVPVQVTWLAYPGSTGLAEMDYRLTDPYLDPPSGEDDRHFSEKPWRLPETYWCYEPRVDIAVNRLPALDAGHVTFGCLNSFMKVNDEVLRLWGQVLAAVPNARFVMLAPQGSTRARVLKALGSAMGAAAGAVEGRVRFVDFGGRSNYFQQYHGMDIALDTFPYNGHTTSLDSFYMGVPVVTLAGKTIVGRGGVCFAMNLGLPELIARSPAAFVEIARGLAADVPHLAAMRAKLRSRLERSPLMDVPRFTRNLESAFRGMWQAWCRGRPGAGG